MSDATIDDLLEEIGIKTIEKGKTSAEYADEIVNPKKTFSGSRTQVYQRLSRDMAKLAEVQQQIDFVSRLQQSPTLRYQEQAKIFLSRLLGNAYIPPSLDYLFDQQTAVVYVMRRSLSDAQTHSQSVLEKIQEYLDDELIPELEGLAREVRTADSHLEQLTAAYEENHGRLMDSSVGDEGHQETYILENRLIRGIRKTRQNQSRALQRVSFRAGEKETLEEHEAMANAAVTMIVQVGDSVDAVLQHSQNVQHVYSLFRDGAETMGALQDAFGGLRKVIQLQTQEIGTSLAKMADRVKIGTEGHQLPAAISSELSGYRADVVDLVNNINVGYEQQGRRFLDGPGK